jgi:outer membrane lipase/esterase
LAASTRPYFAGTGGTHFAITGAGTGSAGIPPGVLAQVGGIWLPAFGAAGPNAPYVLVSSLRNLGNPPEANLLDLKFASADASKRFNALRPGLLNTGEGFGLDMSFLDMAGLMEGIITDATTNGGGVYGITNVSPACGGFTDGDPNNACATSLFSDTLHPSAATHRWTGAAALDAVVPVPEPEISALMTSGLVLVARQARRIAFGA